MKAQAGPYIITIVGAESSGKTTLAKHLSAYFKAPLVTEYAREYLLDLGRSYNMQDLENIARTQSEIIESAVCRIQAEAEAFGEVLQKGISKDLPVSDVQNSSLYKPVIAAIEEKIGFSQSQNILIVDGGILNLQLWARIKFDTSLPVIEESLRHDQTSLYILCRPLPTWEPDPLREAPAILDRVWIYNHYLDELTRRTGDRMHFLIASLSIGV